MPNKMNIINTECSKSNAVSIEYEQKIWTSHHNVVQYFIHSLLDIWLICNLSVISSLQSLNISSSDFTYLFELFLWIVLSLGFYLTKYLLNQHMFQTDVMHSPAGHVSQ
jgi:hypothetical protein